MQLELLWLGLWRWLRRLRKLMSDRLADRFGLSWRPALAAELWLALDAVDVLEVMAEDFLDVPDFPTQAHRTKLDALIGERPLIVHGVSLGLASPEPVDPGRLARLAALVHHVRAERWSEHLAFVRLGDLELHHLAAPPRDAATLAGLVQNVNMAYAALGSRPALENVATLVTPLGSELDEPAWAAAVYAATGAPPLLDLHNLWANATTFGWDPGAYLAALPADPSEPLLIHLAGGRPIGSGRILDDHLHPVPEPVFELLSEVARLRPEPLTVILERDGYWPPLSELLAELDHARAAVQRGRTQRAQSPHPPTPGHPAHLTPRTLKPPPSDPLAKLRLLARLYTEPTFLERFLADPTAALASNTLDIDTLEIDAEGLRLTALGFAKKRSRAHTHAR